MIALTFPLMLMLFAVLAGETSILLRFFSASLQRHGFLLRIPLFLCTELLLVLCLLVSVLVGLGSLTPIVGVLEAVLILFALRVATMAAFSYGIMQWIRSRSLQGNSFTDIAAGFGLVGLVFGLTTTLVVAFPASVTADGMVDNSKQMPIRIWLCVLLFLAFIGQTAAALAARRHISADSMIRHSVATVNFQRRLTCIAGVFAGQCLMHGVLQVLWIVYRDNVQAMRNLVIASSILLVLACLLNVVCFLRLLWHSQGVRNAVEHTERLTSPRGKLKPLSSEETMYRQVLSH